MSDFSHLFAPVLFGSIGFAAFIYGKKTSRWKQMVIGVALIAYPYLIVQTWLLYAIGAALTASIFIWRD